MILVMGHSKYDANNLKSEYDRNVGKGLDIAIPRKKVKKLNL